MHFELLHAFALKWFGRQPRAWLAYGGASLSSKIAIFVYLGYPN
ncbi:hypothetical protein NGR_b08860 (plasmid) [Sinorhizobium fredii NGR234]|uniref:Uncharacterized protein n=1 Tax=Sinorhizobium fredii (strain NBRC 101917 / NGR234) TaxID=394 RepID=C3KQI4_SINFN|nr:hypothetical protein NGR_b08860 [Sinorhizobium fredii NGR234]